MAYLMDSSRPLSLRLASFFAAAALFLAACPQNDDGGDGGVGDGGMVGPPCTNCTPTGAMTFLLLSRAGGKLGTTPTMEKVLREAAPPTMPGDSIAIYAAKNEYEPFQVVVRPDGSAMTTLTMTPFSGPGSIPLSNIELRRVG